MKGVANEMKTYTKTKLLAYYKELGKTPPKWVLEAPENALFNQGLTPYGHVPLYIKGMPAPKAQPDVVSIDFPDA